LVFHHSGEGRKSIKLDLKERYKPNKEILGRIFQIGLPAALEQLVMRSGQVMFARIVSSLGTVTFAAHQVAMNILSLTFMPGQAFGIAATTLVGQNLGAKRPDDAEHCANTARNMGMAVGILMVLVFIFFGNKSLGYTPTICPWLNCLLKYYSYTPSPNQPSLRNSY